MQKKLQDFNKTQARAKGPQHSLNQAQKHKKT